MRKIRKAGKNIVYSLFLMLFMPILLITVGFSALSTSLSINGIAMFRPVSMILEIGNEPDQSTIENNNSYSYTKDTINIAATLDETSDQVIYNVSIRNFGQTNKILSEIVQDEFTNSDMRYSLNGLAIGDVFLPGQTVNFQVTFKYKSGVSNPSNTNINAILRFIFDDYEIPPISNGYFMPFDGEDNLFGLSKDTITGFKRNTTLSLSDVQNIAGVQLIHNVSNDQYNSLADIYGWVDSNNVFNWWSEAETVYFHPTTLNIFRNMPEVLEVDLRGTSTEKVENFAHMFDKDRKLVAIKGKINTSGLVLQYNNSYNHLDLDDNSSSGVGLAFMFNDCNALQEVDLSEIVTSNATDMKRMFGGCNNLTEIDVSGFDTSNVVNMYWMFRNNQKLTSLDLSSFDTSNVVNMLGMFINAQKLTTITLGEDFDTSNVMLFNNMFNNNTSLLTINARRDFVIQSGATHNAMFTNDKKLVGARDTTYATPYDSSHVNGAYAKIALGSQPGYFTQGEEMPRYNIVYNLHNGTADNPQYYYSNTPTFSLVAPVKTGYTFVGWTGSNGNTPQTTVTITQGTIGNKHYEAHYTPNNYIVQFDPNGGTGNVTFEDFIYDEVKPLTLNTFTKDGYYFIKWNTAADGSGVSYIDGQGVVNVTTSGTITLYAIWGEGVDLFPSVFNLTGPCYFTGPGTNVSGEYCSQYANSDYIDTHVALFSNENKNKDFEITFDITHYVTSEQTETQATIVNSKLEDSGLNYPGFVLRRNSSNLELTARFNTLKPAKNTPGNSLTKVKIARKDGIMYYSFNDASYQVFQDITSYTGSFNTTVTFGASLDGNGEPWRYAKKLELANITIKLGEMDSIITE